MYFFNNEQINNHIIHQGIVVNEFCKRVLSRNIAQSNVLVVTPDIPSQNMSGNGDGIKYLLKYFSTYESIKE